MGRELWSGVYHRSVWLEPFQVGLRPVGTAQQISFTKTYSFWITIQFYFFVPRAGFVELYPFG